MKTRHDRELDAEAEIYATAVRLFKQGWGLFAIAGIMWRVTERIRGDALELYREARASAGGRR